MKIYAAYHTTWSDSLLLGVFSKHELAKKELERIMEAEKILYRPVAEERSQYVWNAETNSYSSEYLGFYSIVELELDKPAR